MDKKALYSISYGLYVVTSAYEGKLNGQIANSVFQVTSEPPQVAVCLNKQNLTHEFIEKSGIFGISVLNKHTPFTFIGLFGFRSGRDIDKFADFKGYKLGKLGVPLITEYSVAVMELEVSKSLDVGTHTIFVGKLSNAEVLSSEDPLTYDYYRKVIKGKSPKTAPSYVED